ncbi:MAG TPA: cellulase family glycosylhydrolase [Lentisphaeria bacterium]|nr:cellulase family glycosylhydrolase [Lentisphaeria bacterium]
MMQKLLMSMAGMFLAATCAQAQLWPKDPANTAPWRLDADSQWLQEDGATVLKVSVPPERAAGMHGATMGIDLTPYHGKQIEISCISRHEKLSKPSKGYLGFKFMLSFVSKGTRQYPGGGGGISLPADSDWRQVAFIANIPDDATEGLFNVGVQEGSGTVWFKDLSIREVNIYPTVAELPEGFRCDYDDAVKKLPILRGCMSPGLSEGAKAEDLEELARWGANVIRWQLSVPKEARMDKEQFRAIFRQHMKNLDEHLPLLTRLGLNVIVDMHCPPGGRYRDGIAGTAGVLAGNVAVNESNCVIFFEKEYLDLFVDIWREIAQHYRGVGIVVAYDLINEPTQYNEVPYDYLTCQYLAAQAIREIDPVKPIIIAANEWSNAKAFGYLQPLPLKNLIYQGHMYDPGEYTHQGVGPGNMEKVLRGELKTYPGLFGGIEFNKDTLRKVLQPIRDFQLKYGARIYMGEFSAIRFAPGAAQYLEDVISLFEEYGWDWSYHAFREWYNWSVEYDENPHNNQPATTDTERKKILLKYFSRNQKRP